MPNATPEQIQRLRPFGRLAPRRVLPLPPEKIHPVIRIAHRPRTALRIVERIIFDHELVLFLEGRGELMFSGAERCSVGPHHLLFIPPFAPHAIEVKGRCEHVAVHFDFAPGVPPHARDPERRKPYEVQLAHGLSLPRHVVLSPSDRVEESLIELVRAREQQGPLAELEASALLTRVILLLLQRSSRTTARHASSNGSSRHRTQVRLERALAFTEAHFNEKLSAAQLAEVAGLSASHFNRLFHGWTGYSPIEYLRRLRVDKARKLLADVDLSIKEIAHRCGFDDAYHFSKVFRQVDGLPPTRFRESLLTDRA
ncbi:MAG: helix-turn-helix domain-containing protein [Tepidisphaeraceae bacterium]